MSNILLLHVGSQHVDAAPPTGDAILWEDSATDVILWEDSATDAILWEDA